MPISAREIFFRICLLFCLSVLLPTISVAAEALQTRSLQEPVFGSEFFLTEAGQENSKILLLVHGVGDEAGHVWDNLIPELSREYHLVIPDLPGFGRSAKGNHLYSPAAYAAFLDWLIKSLPDKPVHLVGHSLGGGISLFYAAQYGANLKSLVLIDSVGLLHRQAVSKHFINQQIHTNIPFFSETIDSGLSSLAGRLLEKASQAPLDPDLILSTPFMREKFLAAQPARIAALALVQTDYSLLLSRVETPTWLLWGEEDNVAPVRIGKLLDWTLAETELVVLPGLGHSPMLEDSRRFLATLRGTLQRSPVELYPRQPVGTKTGRCDSATGRVFHGRYATLQIDNCKDVLLRDVTAATLEISDSQVVVESSRFIEEGAEPAVKLVRSQVTMTGVDLSAETAILTEQSRLDLAGVRFLDVSTAISAAGAPSTILCSSCLKRFEGVITGLHLSRSLAENEQL